MANSNNYHSSDGDMANAPTQQLGEGVSNTIDAANTFEAPALDSDGESIYLDARSHATATSEDPIDETLRDEQVLEDRTGYQQYSEDHPNNQNQQGSIDEVPINTHEEILAAQTAHFGRLAAAKRVKEAKKRRASLLYEIGLLKEGILPMYEAEQKATDELVKKLNKKYTRDDFKMGVLAAEVCAEIVKGLEEDTRFKELFPQR